MTGQPKTTSTPLIGAELTQTTTLAAASHYSSTSSTASAYPNAFFGNLKETHTSAGRTFMPSTIATGVNAMPHIYQLGHFQHPEGGLANAASVSAPIPGHA